MAGQGLSLLLFLNQDVRVGPKEGAFFLLIFSVYLFDALGIFSPEDRINQPHRFWYFNQRWRSQCVILFLSLTLAFTGLALDPEGGGGLAVLSLIFGGMIYFCYSVLRFKEGKVLKPILVSGVWVVMLYGSSKVFNPWIFLLLFLDSLWLDLKDQKGDVIYGIKILLSQKLLIGFHLGFLLLLLTLRPNFMVEFIGAQLMILASGLCLIQVNSRALFGSVMTSWAYFLFLSLFFKPVHDLFFT